MFGSNIAKCCKLAKIYKYINIFFCMDDHTFFVSSISDLRMLPSPDALQGPFCKHQYLTIYFYNIPLVYTVYIERLEAFWRRELDNNWISVSVRMSVIPSCLAVLMFFICTGTFF